jgi:hypothetical protein
VLLEAGFACGSKVLHHFPFLFFALVGRKNENKKKKKVPLWRKPRQHSIRHRVIAVI